MTFMNLNFAGLIYLLIAHYFIGRAILRLFNLHLRPLPTCCLAFIVSVPVLSMVPCCVQLLKLPIDLQTISIGVGILAGLSALSLLIKFKKPKFNIDLPSIYELPFITVYVVLLIISVWRCYYYPPTARDMLSGPELIAEYAVREKTMINSVFSIDLQTTNNYFKSPYITSLQIIYKLLVQPFGQLWLSVLVLPYTVWLYSILREKIHPVLAGALMLCYFAIPDLFAYTFLILYDYSNMVFFFAGYYFIARHMETKRMHDFAFSAFLFGLSTYIRTETLVMVGMTTPLLIYYFYKQEKMQLQKIAIRIVMFSVVPLAFYYLCNHIFVHNFVPVEAFEKYLSSQINPNLGKVSTLFDRFSDMNELLLFSKGGEAIYGCYIYIFCFFLFADVVWPRKYNLEARIALYGIAVVYFGLPFLNYLFPLVDLFNTTKRGFFKALPLMAFYMANSGILLRVSGWMKNWEYPALKAKKDEPEKQAKPIKVIKK